MPVIYLVRHGQASFLKSNYDQLSDLGIEQSRMLGNALRNRKIQFNLIESGTVIRQQETASNCLHTMGSATDFKTYSGWNEYDHMELLRKHRSDLNSIEAITEFLSKQENPVSILQNLLYDCITDWIKSNQEYSLDWGSFQEKVMNSLDEAVQQLRNGEKALIFTSGGPVSVILIKLLGLKDEQFTHLLSLLVNTSVTKVLFGKSGFTISSFNDHSHLEHKPDWITYR